MPLVYLALIVAYVIGAWLTILSVYQQQGWLTGTIVAALWMVTSSYFSKKIVKRLKARRAMSQTN
jgi:uncharacterized membrane protein